MSEKFTAFFLGSFFCCFFTFMAVHYAYMKTPSLDRSIASFKEVPKPWYDASWKY